MEVCTIDMFSGSKDLSEGAQSRLAGYLEGFHAPVIKDGVVKCVKCGDLIFSGGIMDALMSSFTWGIAHGEGFCTNCDWPIRMYHFVQLVDDEDKRRFEFPLAHRCYTDKSHAAEVDPVLTRQGGFPSESD